MVLCKPHLSLPQRQEHNVQCSGTSRHPPACLYFGRPQGTEDYSACTTQPVKTTPHQEKQQGLITVAHRLSEHSSTYNHAECRIQSQCKKELRSGRQGRARCERKLRLSNPAQEHMFSWVSRCLGKADGRLGS